MIFYFLLVSSSEPGAAGVLSELHAEFQSDRARVSANYVMVHKTRGISFYFLYKFSEYSNFVTTNLFSCCSRTFHPAP